jgi:serine/threonine-protein kinase HipA
MNRCPITYDLCNHKYSSRGLKLLSRTLTDLKDFPYSTEEQIQLAAKYTDKLSIQGVQPKLSAILDVTAQEFKVVESNGHFILKPPHQVYSELPANEDLTMKLAAIAGLEVPLHGMIYSKNQSLTYFIKRFDRKGKYKKVATEDFSQVLEYTRDTKYDSSTEEVIHAIDEICTFPMIEKVKLFRMVLFSFLVGNDDLHLKNFSIIRQDQWIGLSPVYDLVNSTIVTTTKDELGLPLTEKKSNFKKNDFLVYLAQERLGIPENYVKKIMNEFKNALPLWNELIEKSFLSTPMQHKYAQLIQNRWKRVS